VSGERDVSKARDALAQAEASFRRGRWPETIAHCERALALESTLVPGLSLLAAACQRQGLTARALQALERAAVLAPLSADAHFNVGALRCQTGDFAGGVAALEAAYRIEPATTTVDLLAQALNARGNAQRSTAPNLAREDFARALSLRPAEVGYALNLGNAEVALGNYAAAVAVLRQAAARAPRNTDVRLSLSRALIGEGSFDSAIAEAERAVRDSGGDARARVNLGAALGRAGRPEQAVAVYRTALAADPRQAAVWANLGNILQELADIDGAIDAYDRALAVDPRLPTAIEQRGLALLLGGRLREGWRAFLDREVMQGRAKDFHRQPLPDDLTGKTILVRRDQGLGDEIFFLRFIGRLKARGARVLYEAGAKLVPVLAGWPAIDGLSTIGTTGDFVVAVSDLPYLLGSGDADYPESIRLGPSAGALTAARHLLVAAGPPPYLGLTWRAGTPNDPKSLYKEAPPDRLIEVLRGQRHTVVSLQRAARSGELDHLRTGLGRPVADAGAFNDDLATMLALLSLLDEYVTVSNTNVHLRETVRRPSRVLIPTPEFRWMAKGDESPWFPLTKLYRRTPAHDWTPALAALARDLSGN